MLTESGPTQSRPTQNRHAKTNAKREDFGIALLLCGFSPHDGTHIRIAGIVFRLWAANKGIEKAAPIVPEERPGRTWKQRFDLVMCAADSIVSVNCVVRQGAKNCATMPLSRPNKFSRGGSMKRYFMAALVVSCAFAFLLGVQAQ